jgi:hypothetical protein
MLNDTRITTTTRPVSAQPARPTYIEADILDLTTEPSRLRTLAVVTSVPLQIAVSVIVAIAFGLAAVAILIAKGWLDVLLVAAVIALATWISQRMDGPGA